MNNTTAIPVGIAAGLTAGLMVLSAPTFGMAAVVFLFLAPLSIYIAAMGWGTVGGIIATLAGAGTVLIFGGTGPAIISALLLFVPASYTGYLANLGQRDVESDKIVWFPLSHILFRLMLILIAGFLIFGAMSGYEGKLASEELTKIMTEFMKANPDLPNASEEQLAERIRLTVDLLPLMFPALWLLIHVGVAALAATITRRLGFLARGNEDIAASLNLPPAAIGLFAAGIIGVLVADGSASDVAAVILGVSIVGYALVGLARLHHATRGMNARGLILWAAYGSIVVFSLPILIFTVMGLMRSFSQLGSGTPRPPTSNEN